MEITSDHETSAYKKFRFFCIFSHKWMGEQWPWISSKDNFVMSRIIVDTWKISWFWDVALSLYCSSVFSFATLKRDDMGLLNKSWVWIIAYDCENLNLMFEWWQLYLCVNLVYACWYNSLLNWRIKEKHKKDRLHFQSYKNIDRRVRRI